MEGPGFLSDGRHHPLRTTLALVSCIAYICSLLALSFIFALILIIPPFVKLRAVEFKGRSETRRRLCSRLILTLAELCSQSVFFGCMALHDKESASLTSLEYNCIRVSSVINVRRSKLTHINLRLSALVLCTTVPASRSLPYLAPEKLRRSLEVTCLLRD